MIGDFSNAIAALILVLALMGLIVWILRRFGLTPAGGMTGQDKKLKILEARMLDSRNRLVLAQWRGRQYLLSVGQDGTRLIDTGHAAPETGPGTGPGTGHDGKPAMTGNRPAPAPWAVTAPSDRGNPGDGATPLAEKHKSPLKKMEQTRR